MKVSIIIPVYNVKAYIVECLESVAHQTYQGEMECLIVDDCGTDQSIALAEDFIRSYHQGDIHFRILHHDHNRGLSAARNTGTDAATGDYIYYLDSDDAIIPETIEEMMQVVHKHPQVEMVQGGIDDIRGGSIFDFTTLQLPEFTCDAVWIAKNMFLNLPVSSWNRLLKRDFLQEEKIMFHEGILHEDVPYWFLLSLKCHRMGFVKKNTYLFRTRAGSITASPQEERAMQSRIIIMHDCIDTYQLCKVQNKMIRKYALRALWRKWLSYMVLNKYEVLLPHQKEISNISSQILAITPWPKKIWAEIFHLLPLKVKESQAVVRKFELLLC